MTKTIKKSINIYPNLTFEDCVNELRCSKLRKWLIIKLTPQQFLFQKIDTIMTAKAGEVIANITLFPDMSGIITSGFDIGEDHHD